MTIKYVWLHKLDRDNFMVSDSCPLVSRDTADHWKGEDLRDFGYWKPNAQIIDMLFNGLVISFSEE